MKTNYLNPEKGKSKDKKLFSKIKKNKDKEAFIEAYDLYIDDVFRFIYFKVGNKEEANDITSSVFLKTWNYVNTETLKDVKTLRALIYRIARNAVIDHYRQSYKQTQSIEGDGTLEKKMDIPDEGQDIAGEIELNEEMQRVLEKLDELKDEYREVIVLRFINELNFQEIAEVTGKSKNNIRVLTHRALKALKELLEE